MSTVENSCKTAVQLHALKTPCFSRIMNIYANWRSCYTKPYNHNMKGKYNHDMKDRQKFITWVHTIKFDTTIDSEKVLTVEED